MPGKNGSGSDMYIQVKRLRKKTPTKQGKVG